MLPVTRANLDHICCICLLDIRPSMFAQKVYDVKRDNMSKVLKTTAHITILKNPINQKYVNDYCRKICEICFVKTQYSFFFREKIIASTATLKEILESGDLEEKDIERLTFFCRICLNIQKTTKDVKYLNMVHLNWLKNCSGIRYTSLIDTEAFRIKEGTNINEIAVINDKYFPRIMCPKCFKKLQNVEEFRKAATQSFEYMISVMGDVTDPEYCLETHEIKKYKENITNSQPTFANISYDKEDCAILKIENIRHGKENVRKTDFSADILQHHEYSNVHHLEDDTLKDVMELMDDILPYSDNSNEEFILNITKNDFEESNDNKSSPLKKIRTKKFKQTAILNKKSLKCKEENVETKEAFKPKLECYKNEKPLDESKKGDFNPSNVLATNAKKLKENNDTSHADNAITIDNENTTETFICEECSKPFATRYKYKRHKRTVHKPNSTMHECLICSKLFKRKSHLTDHIRTVHEKLRPFKCSYCSKTFSANSSKRVHELTHTGDYPFICKRCGKGFRQSSQLKIHLEIHTSNPELLCPICKRSQKSQSDLDNHLISHSDKRLQCPLCGKLFSRSYHLKDHHNAVHLKLRPFKCEFCELAFGDRKTRRIHEKSHTEDRPMICNVCKSGFKTHFSLSRHMNQFGHKTEIFDNKSVTKKKNSSKSHNEEMHSAFEL